MNKFRVGNVDVIFEDKGKGQGKIIISDDDNGYNFSHFWNAMGDCSLREFVCQISSDYFVNKLGTKSNGEFDNKKTFVNFRKFLKEEFYVELPFYKHMPFQKHFRKELKNFQRNICSDRQFIDELGSFPDCLDFFLIENKNEMQYVETCIKKCFSVSEPWDFINHKESLENIFLNKFHKKLKKHLKKPVQLSLF